MCHHLSWHGTCSQQSNADEELCQVKHTLTPSALSSHVPVRAAAQAIVRTGKVSLLALDLVDDLENRCAEGYAVLPAGHDGAMLGQLLGAFVVLSALREHLSVTRKTRNVSVSVRNVTT